MKCVSEKFRIGDRVAFNSSAPAELIKENNKDGFIIDNIGILHSMMEANTIHDGCTIYLILEGDGGTYDHDWFDFFVSKEEQEENASIFDRIAE